MRVAILLTHPIQYFVPLFRLLGQRRDLDFRVFYHTRLGTVPYRDGGFDRDVQWDIPLLEGYPHRFLSDRSENGGCQWRILWALLQDRPDVLVVHGYASATNLLAMLFARLLGIRVFMRGDTRIQQGRASGLRRWMKRIILSLCDGAIAVGSANSNYYRLLGMQESKIFFAPFSVDNKAFSLPVEDRQVYRAAVRRELGIPDDALVVLFASKLIRRKRAADLITAFSRVYSRFPHCHLVVVGSGVEEVGLRCQASEVAKEHVHFLGFQNQTVLPRTFAACDVFVLPSDNEPWGLIVNEAMAAGLPVIVSDDVGAAPDLVAGTGAGMVFPCGDIDALSTCLEKILGNSVLRQGMAMRAVETIARWDVTCTADAIAAAAWRIVTDKSRRRDGATR